MPFSEHRRDAAPLEDYEADAVELRDIPPGWDLPPSPGPRKADYVHSVFYDPQRFETFPDRLLQQVRGEFPDLPLWQTEAVHAASLRGRMAAYSPAAHRKFLRFGYVAELEQAVFGSGKFPKRSLTSQAAWNAFFVNASFAEGIADALRKCRDDYPINWVFRDPHANALVPIVGLADENAPTRGTTMLCGHGNLLLAPRAILNERRNGDPVIGYSADAVTLKTASTRGRAGYGDWSSDTRREILDRLEYEVRAWCNAGLNPEAFLLWVLQTVAILRVQATDFKGRERPAYILGDADAKRRDVEAELDLKLTESGLEQGDDCPIEMRRPPVTARADVISMLAGGIGLEEEAIWRDDEVLRANLARQEIGSLAEWIGRLKRFHRETLSPWHARLIEEILTDTPVTLNELEMTGDDWSAPRLIRAQFPDDVWQGLVDAALYTERGETDVEVSYNWNDDPLQQAAILLNQGERNEERMILTGPLLDLSAARRTWWHGQLEQFRRTGSLTI